MADDITESPLPEIDPATALDWQMRGDAVILDVREASEYDFENIPGSVLLPLSFLDPKRAPAIFHNKVVVICAMGKRGAAAQKQLTEYGMLEIYNLTGGIAAWKKAGLEVQGGKYEAMDYSI
ncbi:rhodanese-like domain-containing protein [Magnetospira sp. QH-2]|uniref:rhodanese-like domain-containing protein n=1 Tax=Magnetospira sp. (strain QH-2) TaxID=1288970 RepID=UPI0005FA1A6B|nr:rhodanese-like domain-containing protein [Magnetospira sp. QH-2]